MASHQRLRVDGGESSVVDEDRDLVAKSPVDAVEHPHGYGDLGLVGCADVDAEHGPRVGVFTFRAGRDVVEALARSRTLAVLLLRLVDAAGARIVRLGSGVLVGQLVVAVLVGVDDGPNVRGRVTHGPVAGDDVVDQRIQQIDGPVADLGPAHGECERHAGIGEPLQEQPHLCFAVDDRVGAPRVVGGHRDSCLGRQRDAVLEVELLRDLGPHGVVVESRDELVHAGELSPSGGEEQPELVRVGGRPAHARGDSSRHRREERAAD
ncbi:hypothetical protein [Nocardioides acrostichi]|uniref:Uncharacterized protein n=1 Tax=Nocardioides acrostichi TaxID=2784339 RepID=A0A930V2K1_9ACTN|nr:hypothetical protein [Nocardioides acrostichi]MBF4162585.1 hypothetical protein [Nocardioides acrostichi]